MKKLFCATLSATVALSVFPITSSAALNDVAGHPYEQAIKALNQQGIIAGYPDHTFRPEQALSRWDVVILLGRYLERNGYMAPFDYKTNMRFSDLNPRSGDALLKYAAIVKDNGIFTGSNGKLLHNELISKHHAALVLVRAFSIINGLNYNNHYEKGNVVDIEGLDATSKATIQLLYQWDLVNGQYFKPNTPTTRGEFAHFLYGLQKQNRYEKLEVLNVSVISSTRLLVSLSDGYEYNVYLKEPLEENQAQEVTFTLFGKQFTQIIHYGDVLPLEIVELNPLNAAQFEIVFSKPIDIPFVLQQYDINKLISMSSRDSQATPSIVKGQLSDDQMTLTITTNVTTQLLKRYYVTVNGLHSVDGETLEQTREQVTFTEDKVKPVVQSVIQKSLNEVVVKFSEPVTRPSILSTRLPGTNGAYVYGITSTFSADRTELTIQLKNARVNSKDLANEVEVEITLGAFRDMARNETKDIKTIVKKSVKKTDVKSPKLLKATQVGGKQFALTFDEPVRINSLYNIQITQNDEQYWIDSVDEHLILPNTYIVTMEEYLQGSYKLETVGSRHVYDITGNGVRIGTVIDTIYDARQASVIDTKVVRENNKEVLVVYFDKDIQAATNAKIQFTGSYVVAGQRYSVPLQEANLLKNYNAEEKSVKVVLSELLKDVDRDGARFEGDIQFTHIENGYGISLTSKWPVSFIRTKDFTSNSMPLYVESVHTSRTSPLVKNSSEIVVTFNAPVQRDVAEVLQNYELGSYKLAAAKVNPTNNRQVILTIRPNSISYPATVRLYIENLKADASVKPMESYYESIYVNENMAPTYTYNTAAITSANTMTLTFSEALLEPPADVFIVTTNKGQVLETVAALDPTNNRKVVLTFANALPRSTSITITTKANRQLHDMYYNAAAELKINYYIPWTLPTN